MGMEEVLHPPQRDELGLPPNSVEDDEPVSDEMLQRLMAGDFPGFNLPKPSSFPTAVEAQREARQRKFRNCLFKSAMKHYFEPFHNLIPPAPVLYMSRHILATADSCPTGSTEVLASWNKLRAVLERHEEALRRRWMKKTKTQRTTIVLKAWPNMSPKHSAGL